LLAPIQLQDHLSPIKPAIALRKSESNPKSLNARGRCRTAFAPTASLCRAEANWRRQMTTMSQSTARPAFPNLLGRFVRRMGTWTHAAFDYLERRAAIKTLRELDDRALRDIGIARCHIETAVGGAFNPDMGRLR
jgi:uncharacterized protein YjiS (DUF1127 family)